ncbi:MAG TPA: nicotinate (nicotinamide) nucleotide adenylyltransferase [Paludibacteraceae bacterium]|jgi:nicotinate-nucleotide adenylyltransferase|nr:nicotinate (nicotinamide) nucleotide adenylyltransferase [Paludibacteraceae bacterium]
MRKKVGLYFGSFNPFHLGHQKLAEFLLDRQVFDEVWFVVSPRNPLKPENDLLDEDVRLEMVKMAIKDNPKLKVSNLEFSLPKPSYTIDSLHAFSSKYPENDFSLLIGSDNAKVFDQWKSFQQILNEYPVLVYPRSGFNKEGIAKTYPQMKWLETPLYDISSTEIRRSIQQGKEVKQWLHPAVYQYIVDKNLYR